MLFASDEEVSKLTVSVGVAAGSLLSQYVNPKQLQYVAGAGFIAIGIWTLIKA
jgi:putative Ca2+/H+ antiporter (TMEM165/GDT1 family)